LPDLLRNFVVAGPKVRGLGSLYTSVIPNVLVKGIRRAILASPALKVYVCNVATQPGETDGYGVAEHVRAIEAHVGRPFLDVVLVNSNAEGPLPASAQEGEPVRLKGDLPRHVSIVTADVVDEANRYHHDPYKLARAIMRLYDEREQVLQRAASRESASVS